MRPYGDGCDALLWNVGADKFNDPSDRTPQEVCVVLYVVDQRLMMVFEVTAERRIHETGESLNEFSHSTTLQASQAITGYHRYIDLNFF